MTTDPTMVRRPERRFGWLGIALAGAGGFLAGVLLIAVLGGAKPVVTDHTKTVAARVSGVPVPRLVGMHLDEALGRLQAVGLRGESSGGGLFGFLNQGGLTVVRQDPSPGSRLHRGDTVHLDVQSD
jgi:PASTA domain-containing protein